jgi:hypothetical protein
MFHREDALRASVGLVGLCTYGLLAQTQQDLSADNLGSELLAGERATCPLAGGNDRAPSLQALRGLAPEAILTARPAKNPSYAVFKAESGIDSISAFISALRAFFRSRRGAAVEVLALRQQVAALEPKRARPILNRTLLGPRWQRTQC